MCKVFNCRRLWKEKHKALASIAVTVIFSLIISPASLLAASNTGKPAFNQDMLAAVAELYGISEGQAIERLARESEAAITLKLLQGFPIKSYAGSWFDESSLQLKTAIADPGDLAYLKMLNVEPVYVSNSLVALQNKLNKATNRLNLVRDLGSSVIKSYIDFKSNIAVLTVDTLYANSVRSELDGVEFAGLLRIEEGEILPELSTGLVRGADGTRNLTWVQQFGGVWPCSIGASIAGGYVTAGHCGYAGNNMGDSAEELLGVVQNSTWEDSNPSIDVGHVVTVAGWTPSPQVNGYSDGVFTVSAEWAGIVEFPVGSTVCRYGQTSGGPHCGTVDQINLNVLFGGGHTVTGVTRLTGGCSDDGDSGGPYVAGTGQIQGTNIGTLDAVSGDLCPIRAIYGYFQPIKDALDQYAVILLTTHGSSAPQVNSVKCPDMGSSGSGSYHCLVTSIDSQGEIQLQWSTSTGSSSTSPSVFGTCSNWETVSVTLQASNTYGSSSKYYSFPCPTGPAP